jgi:hypothetical protein
MSSTPVWIPLAVAIVAVAGTLGGAFFTRRWADRREDQRWTREREAEETRWQRERDERREQWEREDHARWMAERRAVYAEFLLSLEAWRVAISRAQFGERPNGALPAETRDALDDLGIGTNRIHETLAMLAPRSVVDLCNHSFITLASWSIDLSAENDNKEIDPLTGKKADYAKKAYEDDKRLRGAIRKDLGVDPPSA